jgi:hypothetical protein
MSITIYIIFKFILCGVQKEQELLVGTNVTSILIKFNADGLMLKKIQSIKHSLLTTVEIL